MVEERATPQADAAPSQAATPQADAALLKLWRFTT